jgi:hypothetical protein
MANKVSVVGLALALLLSAWASALAATPYSPTARRDYRIRNLDPSAKDDPNSRRLWQTVGFTVWTEDGMLEGKPVKVLKREERTNSGDRTNSEFTVDAVTNRLLKVSRTTISRQNKILSESTDYYYNHFYKFPARTIHGDMLPFAAEKMDLTIGRRQDVYVAFGTSMEPWQVFFIPEAEETVTVPAGTFKCVRVRVDYNTDKLPGFFKILPSFLVKQMMSGYSIWVMKDQPHFMVKFQGKLEGLGTPEKVEELIRIK